MKKVLNSISVIIPTFNRAKYLFPTLLSLCNQHCDLNLYEIIIIDSGNDDTEAKVTRIMTKGEN